MTENKKDPTDSLPLTPTSFHILMALARGDNHGYGIMLDIRERTRDRVHLAPGTLYGTIKRMLAAGWIMELDERPDPELDDERRRYYQITDLGHRVAIAEAERLESIVRLARAASLLPLTNQEVLQ
jgi:DNA-binding PadR family transcriptional regulator